VALRTSSRSPSAFRPVWSASSAKTKRGSRSQPCRMAQGHRAGGGGGPHTPARTVLPAAERMHRRIRPDRSPVRSGVRFLEVPSTARLATWRVTPPALATCGVGLVGALPMRQPRGAAAAEWAESAAAATANPARARAFSRNRPSPARAKEPRAGGGGWLTHRPGVTACPRRPRPRTNPLAVGSAVLPKGLRSSSPARVRFEVGVFHAAWKVKSCCQPTKE
jgi:hypothetical protein